MRGQTYRNIVKLVIFGVITSLATYVLAVTISNGGTASTRSYRAVFTDATDLLSGDDVRIAGVRVGSVSSVETKKTSCTPADARGPTHPKTCDYAMVTFGVDKSIPLQPSATIAIRYRNLVGQRYVEVNEQPGGGRGVPEGHTFPPAQTKPALDLTVLFDGFRPLFQALDAKDVNALSYEIISTLQGESGNIDTLVKTTASLTTTLAQRDQVIGAVIDNLDAVLGTVDARDTGLNQLIDQLQRLVTGLAGDRQTIASSLGNINKLATSTASLLKGIRPVLPTDLSNLSAVAHTLATTKNTDGQNSLDEFLRMFPGKLNAIVRTATYGSFFNFWLCDADAIVVDNTGKTVANLPLPGQRLHNTDPVCSSSGG